MTRRTAREPKELTLPPLHPLGTHLPELAKPPGYVAIIMDGGGRWASARGFLRIEERCVGKITLMDVVAGALEIGVKELSAYVFSTGNRKRSPVGVRSTVGFLRQVLQVQRDDLNAWGARVYWVGRAPRFWMLVPRELRAVEELMRNNTKFTLNMRINYGGRTEIADAVRSIVREVVKGCLKPETVDEKMIQYHPYAPAMPDVDLFIRASRELRTSNLLVQESAYAELYSSDLAWPGFDRWELWKAYEAYAERDRRSGGTQDRVPYAQMTPAPRPVELRLHPHSVAQLPQDFPVDCEWDCRKIGVGTVRRLLTNAPFGSSGPPR